MDGHHFTMCVMINIYTHRNGSIKCRAYSKNGQLHRDQALGPAIERFYSDGTLQAVEYWYEGVHHRTDGPAIVQFHPNGSLKRVEYVITGLYHRDEQLGPAVQSWYKTGDIEKIEYWREGKEHRTEAAGPAKQVFYLKNRISTVIYYRDGKCHRDADEPALISHHTADIIRLKSYYKNGKLDRDEQLGPACEWRHYNGQLQAIEYYKEGQLNREGQPARETWYKNGTIKTIEYIKMGKRHRDTGTAHEIHCSSTGKSYHERWVDGVCLEPDQTGRPVLTLFTKICY